MGKKTVKKERVINRLFDLEVDEVSLVDKPAIGESFIKVQKRYIKKGDETVGKKISLKKAMAAWCKGVSKAVDQENTHCNFCQITKEEEAEVIGAGLLCGVCLECAFERMDKGVVDQCIEGTFDFEAYKEANPDDVAFAKSEDEVADEDDTAKSEDEEDDTAKSEDEEESEEEESEEEESDEEDAEKSDTDERLVKVESKMQELAALKEMLEESLELHEQAASALNTIMSMGFASLDLTLKLLEEQAAQAEEMGVPVNETVVEQVQVLQGAIKAMNEDIKKAGAKISNSRLRVLQDVVDKLSQLISSVAGEKVEGTKKSLSVLETMKGQIEELQKGLDSKNEEVEVLTSKLNELDSLGDGSSSIEDDEEEDRELEESNSTKSVFEGLFPTDDIKKRLKSRN